jgi:hypothetical protein
MCSLYRIQGVMNAILRKDVKRHAVDRDRDRDRDRDVVDGGTSPTRESATRDRGRGEGVYF